MSHYWIPDTSIPEDTGRPANSPFEGEKGRPQKKRGRISRFFRALVTLWMDRSRPEGPASWS
ncbi:MAG: hypothetical protein ACTH1D_00400 [Mycobacteriaceae bacterium]|uniref:hypothetical protein n=1 Tax=Corynebacterium sp. TaxID=1720 RepID=UPI003F9AA5F6